MTKLEIAQKCRESAQWVRDHGFVKWTRDDGKDGRCVLGIMEEVMSPGARAMAYPIEAFAPDFTAAVGRPLHDEYQGFGPGYAIAYWNNRAKRTAIDLIDHFEAVALGLEIEVLAGEQAAIPEKEEVLV